MVKYICYLIFGLMVFLSAGAVSSPCDRQEPAASHKVVHPCEDELHNSTSLHQIDEGYIRTITPIRVQSAPKTQRAPYSLTTLEKLARCIRIRYPIERSFYRISHIHPLKFSDGYYVYTLRRILI